MNRNMLILARRDSLEAMRVSAGLTIFGHEVTLVLMGPELSAQEYQSEEAELLDLADIVPLTTVTAMSEQFSLIASHELGNRIVNADAVLSI